MADAGTHEAGVCWEGVYGQRGYREWYGCPHCRVEQPAGTILSLDALSLWIAEPCPARNTKYPATPKRSEAGGGGGADEERMMDIEKRVPVLYLDLDGTVRHGKTELGRFVNGPKDVRVFDEVPALLARYKSLGWRIAAVSNQGGIALGILSMDDCIETMQETHKQTGGAFDKIVWCQHHPDAKDPEMAVCWCRKPRPGLLIEAVHAMRLRYPLEMYPPHLALMVGDRPEDAQAADGANVRFLDAAEWRTGAHLRSLSS